jgi:nicotinate-nucleotide adenylyltransferase
VDTLRHFKAAYPDSQLHFLLGADQWVEFPEWQEPAGITELATLVVVAREGMDPVKVEPVRLDGGEPVDFVSLPVTRVDLSSSDIRSRVKESRSIRYMVPKEVRRIIETHRLYRSIS